MRLGSSLLHFPESPLGWIANLDLRSELKYSRRSREAELSLWKVFAVRELVSSKTVLTL